MKLFIRFTDQSKSFTYGCEYGRLLEKIERGDQYISNNGFPIRVENIDILKDTCTKYGYIPIFSKSKIEGWIEFHAFKNVINN